MNKIGVIFLTFILVTTPKATVQAAQHSQSLSTIQSTIELSDSGEPLKVVRAGLQTLNIQTTQNREVALKQVAEYLVNEKFGTGQYRAFASIIEHESRWDPQAVNRASGACGLPQALPCSKLSDHSPEGQLRWMVSYIAERYGTPNNAWRVWQRQGWY